MVSKLLATHRDFVKLMILLYAIMTELSPIKSAMAYKIYVHSPGTPSVYVSAKWIRLGSIDSDTHA
jgi:hypothetical protein